MLRDIFRIVRSFSKPEKYIFYGAAVVFAASLVTSVWSGIYQNTTLEPASGGEYTEGLVGQPVAVNPILYGESEVDRDLTRILFADLITLSQGYATSSAGKVWSVKLKQDLEWSDGEPITASDVVFTLSMIQNPDTGSPLASAWQGITIDRISDLEVRFTLKSPYGYFLDNLKSFLIAPRHMFEALPPANLHLSDYNLEPVGSGPYKFASYEKQKNGIITAYHLEKNSRYTGEPALIERLNFIFFANYNDAFLSFNNKIIDGLGGFDPLQADSLKINHTSHQVNLPRYYAVFFNPSNNAVLKDKVTREALTLAIDKEQLVRDVLGGYGEISYGPLVPALEGYDAGVYAHEHTSLEEAATLLEKNKWSKDSSGIYTRVVGKNTQRLAFELVTPDIPFLVATAEHLKAAWANLGAEVTIKNESADTLQTEQIKTRAYQALLFGNVLRNSDIYSFWHSGQRFSPGLNLANYQNTKVDALLDSARKSFDPVKRAADLKKIQEIIVDERPAIFLYSPAYVYAAPNDLGGFPSDFILTPSDRFSSVNQWFLETERVFK